MKTVYLDHAATTPVAKEVFLAMKPYFLHKFGNASEPHFLGQEARAAIEGSREKVANFLGASPSEIIFTGSATEAINLAHKGLVEAVREQWSLKKPHLIVSSVEHKAVLESCQHLQKLGLAELTFLPVDRFGLVHLKDVEKAIRPETVLVSVIYANNEVGTIQPVREIGAFIKKLKVKHPHPLFFHTDVTQAIQYLDCQVGHLGADFLSFTGHKFYAPKGVGVLYRRQGTPLVRQEDGGGQEFKYRAGTENVPYIVGLGRALELISPKQGERVRSLCNFLISRVLRIPGIKLTGHPMRRIPHIASFVIERVEGEALLLLLSDQGIFASTGSACTSQSLQPSHVLLSMGVPAEVSHGSLRLSLGKDTTKEEVEYVLQVLPKVIDKLRQMAPKF